MIKDSNLFTVDNLKELLKSFKITSIEIIDVHEIIFKTSNFCKITMFHKYNCCELVRIYSTPQNIDVLVGKNISDVTETVNYDSFDEEFEKKTIKDENGFTWTVYNFSYEENDNEIKKIEIIWFGTSNGCYDEGVQFKCEDIIDLDEYLLVIEDDIFADYCHEADYKSRSL